MNYNSDRLTPCWLANIQQLPDPAGPGMILTYVGKVATYAQLIPISSVAYLLGQSSEIGQISHKAILRWTDIENLTMFSVLLRERVRPDGSVFQQVFKIHRVLETDGLLWWVEAEVELQAQADT